MTEYYDDELRSEGSGRETDYKEAADEKINTWLDNNSLNEKKFSQDYIYRNGYLNRIKNEMRILFPDGQYKSFSKINYDVFSDNYEIIKKYETATGLLRDAAMTCSALSYDDPQRKAKTAAVEALAAYVGYHCALKLKWDEIEDAHDKFGDVWSLVFKEVMTHLNNFINDTKGQKSFRNYIYYLTPLRYSNIKYKLREYSKNPIAFVNCDEYEENKNILMLQIADDISRYEEKFQKIQEIKEALEICAASDDPEYKITRDEYDIIAYNMGFFEGLPERMSEGMTLKEIAGKINKSYDYVCKHFHKAEDKLRKVILKKFYN